MGIDPATRDSLEICRDGDRRGRGQPARLDRCVTAAGRRLLAADLSAPLTERARSRRGWRWCNGFTTSRCAARACATRCAHARCRARAGAAGRRRAEPARPRQLRDGLSARPRLRAELERQGRAPAICLDRCCRELGGHAALTDRLGAALVAEPPIDAAKGGYIAEGYDAALDALRAASQRRAPGDRRAGGALSRGDRGRDAQDPPQCRARLSCRGRRAARRPADGRRTAASPTARRWPGWCASIRPTSMPRRAGWSRRAAMRSPPKRRISRS